MASSIRRCYPLVVLKTCSSCGVEKDKASFYADSRRKDGLRPRCIPCYRQGLTTTSTRRTPGQKADYRRRSGAVSSPYVPQIEIARVAAEKCAMRSANAARRAAALDLQKAETRIRRNAARVARYRAADQDDLRMAWRAARHKKRLRRQNQSDGTLGREGFASLFKAAVHCAYCAVSLTQYDGHRWRATDATLDHVVPLAQGGLHGTANAAVVCAACNFSRRRMSLIEWAATRSEDVLPRVQPIAARALAAHS